MDIKTVTPAQCKGARAMLDMSRADLAERASIAERTVIDFERGARQPLGNNLAAIRAALEKAGVEFIAENGGGAGVRLAKKKGKR
jgi:DNA-binding XRE family transcriptional regulator